MSTTAAPQPYQKYALYGGPVVAVLFYLLVDLSPGNPGVTAVAAVAILMAIWWMTEALPLAVTSLIPIVAFPMLGVMNGRAVSTQYVNYIIFLFMGGFMVALAMERWNLHQRIALNIMVRVGTRPRIILLGFMVACAFLSMWISNTATTMMMVPIAMALIDRLEGSMKDVERYAVGVFLGIAYAASIGGVSTLVGTPPNLVFTKVYNESFPDAAEISFGNWMVFALPFCVVFLIMTWYFLVRVFEPKDAKPVDAGLFRKQLDDLGSMSREEKVVAVVFVLMAVLWLTRADLRLGFVTLPGWSGLFDNPAFFNDGTVSIGMALILFAIPAKGGTTTVLDWPTANKMPWHILLLFGGGFALAKGFTESGLSLFLAEQMQGASGLPIVLLVGLICLVITFLTELTSNTATAQIFLPLMAALTVSIGAPSPAIMVPATMACSFAFMLPVATPPNAIVFGSGRLKIGQMARTGLALNFLGIIGITIYAAIFAPIML